MSTKEDRKRVLNIWKKDPRCYWCKRETTLEGRDTGDVLPHTATLEHLYSKFHPHRLTPNTTQEIRRVLACYECNHKRGRDEFLKRYPT